LVGLPDAGLALVSTRRATWTPISAAIKAIASASASPSREQSLAPLVEGLNNKIRVLQRRAYGLRDKEFLRLKVLTCILPEL